ncbi:unnamed protein product [Dovyalis caffra]|uniref:Uncharacterized protein n=1 Tax=Dovyalis caffra TaxID=77055 RepID=A0AAV1RKG1_9ROSI|nr:unnamed protein product [Dovyalis caffra]
MPLCKKMRPWQWTKLILFPEIVLTRTGDNGTAITEPEFPKQHNAMNDMVAGVIIKIIQNTLLMIANVEPQ